MLGTSALRLRVQALLSPIAERLLRVGITPNFITVTGLIFSIFSSVSIASGEFLPGAILLAFSGLCDMLDGITARVSGRETRFGSFLDSFLDRYSDFFPLAGLGVYGAMLDGGKFIIILSFASLMGAFATSYARAKAESIGVECNVGIVERPERHIILFLTLLCGCINEGLVILCLLTNFTAFQRLIHVKHAFNVRV